LWFLFAGQVGSYFLTGYYNVLTNQPHLTSEFYTDNSSVVRLDCETGRWSFGETVEVQPYNPDLFLIFCFFFPPWRWWIILVL
jgi:hypothetical protein